MPLSPAPYGMAVTHDGILFVSSTPMPGGDVGVYAVDTDGSFEKLAGSENMILPNAVALGEDGTIYATDSADGSVWRFDGNGGAVWLRDPLLGGMGPRVSASPLEQTALPSANAPSFRQASARLIFVQLRADSSRMAGRRK